MEIYNIQQIIPHYNVYMESTFVFLKGIYCAIGGILFVYGGNLITGRIFIVLV